MESIQPQIEDLIANIDDLESALQPILQTALSSSASKLPLLDKAKLYVLATYAIESILFSYLRLNGVDAKAHPVFQELSRVKEYFSKITSAEAAGVGARTLDKAAAGRFIKHGLAGNAKYDAERKARQERERAGAKRKLEEMSTGTYTRFDGAAKRIKQQDDAPKVAVVKASEVDDGDEDDEDYRSAKAKTKVDSAEIKELQDQINALKSKASPTQEEVKQLKKLRKKRKKAEAEAHRGGV